MYSLHTELLTRIIGLTINGLSNLSTQHPLTDYQNELELLDIDIKLKIIEKWLTHTELDSTVDIIYQGISDSCRSIHYYVNEINRKIKEFQLLWFRSWRTINLDMEMKQLKKYNTILNHRIPLLLLLPKPVRYIEMKPVETYEINTNHF